MTNNSHLKYEDTVQCLFFLTSHGHVDLEDFCRILNETANEFAKDYIWHRDKFRITQPVLEATSDLPPYLTSITCFGDNIEDEWFITYLVFKLTEKYENLIVQIEDNDGDLLLIEAADFLPSWANPETTQNRVFVYKNHIHLIPPTLADLRKPLELNDAINLLIDNTEETKADGQIEHAILDRISVEENQSSCFENGTIKFDVDHFFEAVENMLNKVTLNLSDEDSSDFSDNDVEDDEFVLAEKQLDKELEEKMCNDQLKKLKEDSHVVANLKQSMKEEGMVGPTSNILRSIGVSKSELLDSDDDIE
ncbi:unnamed protein product, partial [Iphiclides podalirius]